MLLAIPTIQATMRRRMKPRAANKNRLMRDLGMLATYQGSFHASKNLLTCHIGFKKQLCVRVYDESFQSPLPVTYQ